MRLKTFSAPTMAQAMDLVRRELGQEAIIVSCQRGPDGGGARVTAAVEEDPFEGPLYSQHHDDEPNPSDEAIRQALTFHGTPPRLMERLLDAADSFTADDPMRAFAEALDAEFLFMPLSEGGERPLMLVGPPGVGKTITTAKLAARARLAGQSVCLITTDTRRPGGVEQLQALGRVLGVRPHVAADAKALRSVLKRHAGKGPVFIDTTGINPFSDSEMDALADLAAAAAAEPILVLSAGADAMEAAEMAAAFASLGTQRLLVTRLDLARRLGSILAAADAAHLRFCDVSVTPGVEDGLSAINPISLARLMMPYTAESNGAPNMTEAAS